MMMIEFFFSPKNITPRIFLGPSPIEHKLDILSGSAYHLDQSKATGTHAIPTRTRDFGLLLLGQRDATIFLHKND
jgi:hypothetical protein